MRVRFALFVLLPAAACTQAGGGSRGDGAVDRRGATAAEVQVSEAGKKECVAPDPVNLNASIADVLIVFDRSESMGIAFGSGTRFSVLADVLSNLVDAYQQWIRFGFAQFPGADELCSGQPAAGCCAGPPSVGVAPANGVAVGEAIGNVLLAGNTPTAAALQRAHEYYAGLDDRVADRYVLLATDGLPSCTLLGALAASQPVDGDGGVANPCQDAVDQVNALFTDNIKVVVLAVGAEPADNPEGPPDCLDQMAQAGRMPQSLTGPGYYSAANPESLQETIEHIFGGVERTSCSFDLNPAPAPRTPVKLYVDGEAIPQSRDHGWDFDPAGEMGRISFFGEYCDRVQHFRYSTIEAHFACPLPCGGEIICL